MYAYAAEDYEWWSGRLDRSLGPGTFGDNLTTASVDVGASVIGQRWTVGELVVEVSEPRIPCFKLGIPHGGPGVPGRVRGRGRPGTYLRIVASGTIEAGDVIAVGAAPAHGVTVADVARIFSRDRHDVATLLSVSELSPSWARWAQRTAARQSG